MSGGGDVRETESLLHSSSISNSVFCQSNQVLLCGANQFSTKSYIQIYKTLKGVIFCTYISFILNSILSSEEYWNFFVPAVFFNMCFLKLTICICRFGHVYPFFKSMALKTYYQNTPSTKFYQAPYQTK